MHWEATLGGVAPDAPQKLQNEQRSMALMNLETTELRSTATKLVIKAPLVVKGMHIVFNC